MTRVFIGSSSEAKPFAEDVWAALEDLRKDETFMVESMLWSDTGAFRLSETIIEGIERIGNGFNAAICLMTEDDRTLSRGKADWSTRDNVVLETAFFGGKFGRPRSIVLRIGNPSVPSDLGGVIFGQFPDPRDSSGRYNRDAFRRNLKDRLRPWLEDLAREQARPQDPVTEFPRTLDTLLRTLKNMQGKLKDEDAASFLEQALASLEESPIVDLAVTFANDSLPDCYSIVALDVLGPQAWSSATAFRYLATQLRYYARANVSGQQWDLQVGPKLAQAIDLAIANARKRGLGQSKTFFDNPQDFKWSPSQGRPRMEYGRLLLWTKEELLHPVGRAVIDIHHAFHVPLFFLDTPRTDASRQLDFICYTCSSKHRDDERQRERTIGCISARDARSGKFVLSTFSDGLVRGQLATDLFARWLSTPDLMFAIDARELLAAT